jgi:hypothetical protein
MSKKRSRKCGALARRSARDAIERALCGRSRITRGAEQSGSGSIRADRVIAATGALMKSSRLEVRVAENRRRAVLRVAERVIEVGKGEVVGVSRLQNASVTIVGDRIVGIEFDRAFERRTGGHEIVLFETPPSFERQSVRLSFP